jgi:nucleotide-binding universal stress UspA family protein
MVMKVLICTDGSKQAEEALAYGAPLLQALRAEVTVLGVIEDPKHKRDLERSIEWAQEKLKGLPCSTKTRKGHPDVEILEEEKEEEYDLILLGSIGRRGILGFLLGPTAIKIAKYARTSVLMVRGGERPLRRLLVCAAGVESDLVNIEMAATLSQALQAEAVILHVSSEVAIVCKSPKELEELKARPLECDIPERELLSRELKLLEEKGVEGHVKIRVGLVEDEILVEARKGYDLIVVGAHTAKGISRYLLGDVSGRILEHSPLPVLLVR